MVATIETIQSDIIQGKSPYIQGINIFFKQLKMYCNKEIKRWYTYIIFGI